MKLWNLLITPPDAIPDIAPYRVSRYWREMDDEVILGVCRTKEEAVQLIRQDKEFFGVEYAKENIVYQFESLVPK